MKFPVCSRGKLPFPRRIFLFDISERSAPAFYSRSATCAFLIKPGLDSQQHSRGCLRRRRQSKTKRCDATRAFAKGIQGRKSIAKVRGGGGRRECERSPRDVNAVTHAAKRAEQIKGANFRFSTFARGADASFSTDADCVTRALLFVTQRLVKKARCKHAAVAEDIFSLSAHGIID